MLKIKSIASTSTDKDGKEIGIFSPASDIPQGSKVRFIDGIFEVYEQGEEIPES